MKMYIDRTCYRFVKSV